MEISSSSLDERKLFLKRLKVYQKLPQLFCQEVLGRSNHWDKQLEIMRSVAMNRRTTVRSGHNIGKSYVAADIALWFLNCFCPSIVITTSPTWRQVEKVLWGEIHAHHNTSKIPLSGKLLETELKLGAKWYAIGFSSNVPDSFQGFHEQNILFIVDEPSGVPDVTFDMIEGGMSNENAKLLLIGNPIRDTGYFARSFKNPNFNKIKVSCLESPNVVARKTLYPGLVTHTWVDEVADEWGEESAMFQARVLGEFPKESDDTLIPLSWVEAAVQRYLENKSGTQSGYVCTAVDVARFGQDKTVFVTRCGNRVMDIESYQGFDTMHTVAVAERKMKLFHPVDLVVDDNGVGGGVTDRLKQLGYQNIVPVNNGESAEEEFKFYNRRAELAWRVREAFRLNLIEIPDHKLLSFECSNQYYDQSNKEKLRVMSKQLMKKKSLKSPNFFDALSMTYAKEYSALMKTLNTQYLEEFYDFVHIRDIERKKLDMGVSHYMVLVPQVNGEAYALWYAADRAGRIYFEKEKIINRLTSKGIGIILSTVETELDVKVIDRYTLKKYATNDVLKNRFLLIDQLMEEGLDFEEIDFDGELAGMNIREGLKYDKDLPLSKDNCPFIFFHPSCENAIRSVKYYMNTNLTDNSTLTETVHKAVGLAVLSEPVWIPKSRLRN
jgi:phage terminase large subunit